MKDRIDKINEHKYKLQQKKILGSYFEGASDEEVVFSREAESKVIAKKATEVAYKNVIHEKVITNSQHDFLFKDDMSKEYSKLFLIHSDKIKEDRLNVFLWTGNVYCAALTGELLLSTLDKIISDSYGSDLLIVNAELTFGLCLLWDEHRLSIAFWNNKKRC